MSARTEKFTFQTRPTPAQNEAIRRDHAKRYRDAQAIADFQAARLRHEERQPEPCQFCAVPAPGEDGEPQAWEWVGTTPVLIIVALACVAWVGYFWSYFHG